MRREAFANGIERQPISRRHDRAARFALCEELFFRDFLGFGVMADEDDLDMIVLRAQEAHHPEVERPRNVLLEIAHTPRNIHHGDDDGVRFVLDLFFPSAIAQVFFLEAAKFGVARFARRALDVFEDAAALVEIRQDAGAAYLCELRRLRLHRLLGFVFEIRQVQVFKNQFGNLVNINFGFVVLLPRLVARALPCADARARLAFAPDHVANLRLAVAGADVFLLAVIEAELVLVERTDRHFDAALAVGKNDRFVRDDGAEILLDGVAHALLVALLIDLPFAL